MTYYPSFKEFKKLSHQANVIPVYKEINADLDTPVSSFLKLKKDTYAFLLESVEGQEKIARYSFLGTRPLCVLKSNGAAVEILDPAGNTKRSFTTHTDPLHEMKGIMAGYKTVHVKGLPRFCGGLVGYIGYDAVRFFEEIPDKNPDELNLPDFLFMLADTMLVFDHVNHTIKIVSNVMLPKEGKRISEEELRRLYLKASKNIETIEKDFDRPLVHHEAQGNALVHTPKSNYKKSEFENMVSKAKTYIRKGDIIQVVLSQRFKVKITKRPFDIYRSLRSINPSPYMFYLQLGDIALIGASPEMLVRCEDGIVQTRPIAGTRPRGKTEEDDNKLEKELLGDAKEKAEHIMLVDLGRNDLGRVCVPGKVKVSEFMGVERYSHVMHLVSEVKGVLKKGYDSYDVLRASFPAGTVSGSPKVRAMEIIDEMEKVARGPYAGCVGYFSFSHNMDTCITLRTMVIKDGFAYVQAGAGIVADSVPHKEYTETVNKAKALMEAIVR